MIPATPFDPGGSAMRSRPGSRTSDRRRDFVAHSRSLCTLSDPALAGKISPAILQRYEVHQWKHAAAILNSDFPEHLADIEFALERFRVHHNHVMEGGGGKTKLAQSLENDLASRGWAKKRWDTQIVLDGRPSHSPTHEVDCVKDRVALEIEWSNKDPFYDRDLNNFRLLFELRAISVGVIITKSDELAGLFAELGIWGKYGTSTTWMSKLLPRIEGGAGGGCPLLVFGIRRCLYAEGSKNDRRSK